MNPSEAFARVIEHPPTFVKIENDILLSSYFAKYLNGEIVIITVMKITIFQFFLFTRG